MALSLVDDNICMYIFTIGSTIFQAIFMIRVKDLIILLVWSVKLILFDITYYSIDT